MTRDKRKFCGSFSVRMSTGRRLRIELAQASDWGGPEGLYRMRVSRRWLDDPSGGPRFLGLYAVAHEVAKLALGQEDILPARPDLPRGSVVSAPNGRHLAGETQRDVTRTTTEPFRGFDGRWWVGVAIYGQGQIMLAVDDLVIKRRAEHGR